MTRREHKYLQSKKKLVDPKIRWREMIRDGDFIIKGLERDFPGITYLSEAFEDTEETIKPVGEYPPGYEDWLKEGSNVTSEQFYHRQNNKPDDLPF